MGLIEVEIFDFNERGKVKLPSAFTEKGLYMLATILKSPQATQATISIVETFSKIRELSRNIKELSIVQDNADQKSLMQKSGELIAEFLMMICKRATRRHLSN